ncbi:unnamed protein product, partial [marine sediment metagenome]
LENPSFSGKYLQKEKALWQNAKGLEMVRLPGLVSESVLLWDKIRINMSRKKHGKIIVGY